MAVFDCNRLIRVSVVCFFLLGELVSALPSIVGGTISAERGGSRLNDRLKDVVHVDL